MLARALAMTAACLLFAACSRAEHQRAIETAAKGDTISLDSCAKLDEKAYPQSRVLEPGEVIPPPSPGSWTTEKRVTIDSTELVIPVVAKVSTGDAHTYYVSDLPGCSYFCAVAVTFVTDSLDRTLVEYRATLRNVDLIKDPDAAMGVPGPSRPIRLARSDGLIMETPCGDCNSEQILTKHGRTIASIAFSLDDREGFQPGLMCRLARVASSFAWTR